MPTPTAHALYGQVRLGQYVLTPDQALDVASSLISAHNEANGIVAEGAFA